MSGITDAALDELEKAHKDGIPSQTIVTFLETNGVKFSEATLRKYVQLGLLPHSVRVGRKGKHRGSQGLYPASMVRQILDIKRLLSENRTIEEIRQEYLLLRAEIEALDEHLRDLFVGIETALETRPNDTAAEHVRRDLKDVRATAGDLIKKLCALEERLSMRTRLARAATQ